MKFECGDLERALANPDLMPEAREHLKTCAPCRQEYRLWMDIANVAKELHQEWETPDLWPRIQESLVAEQKRQPNPAWRDWKLWAMAAAALVIAAATPLLWQREIAPSAGIIGPAESQDFLTDQALIEVEKSEAAYRKSIDQLAKLAKPQLQDNSSAKAVNVQEKLLMLDAAIADTRSNVASNRFNASLQTTLAELYREKQQTLKELLTSDRKN